MTFINHNQIKEAGTELPVDVFFFFAAGQSLVQGEINFVGLINHAVPYNGHFIPEMFEISLLSLVNQGSTIGQKQYSFLHPGFPEAVNDLVSSVCFSGSGSHNQKNSGLVISDGFNGAVDGHLLIISGPSA